MLSKSVLELPRNVKRAIVCGVDLTLLPLALWVSFSLRLGEFYLPKGDIGYLFVAVPFIAIPIFIRFGLYRAIIRYIGFRAMWSVVKAVGLYALVWGVLVMLSAIPGVPRALVLINLLVTLVFIGGSREIARWWLTGNLHFGASVNQPERVVIYGAGAAGMQIAAALSGSPDFEPVAYIDDKKSYQGNFIQGLPVYAFRQLGTVIEEFEITDVLLAMPSISRSRRSEIIGLLEPFAVHVMTLPGMDDLASGKVRVNDVKEVGLRDILGRDAVEPDYDLLSANVKGKAVLVTGAGGSIGSELCRQIVNIGPEALILYEQNEHALYTIEHELKELVQETHSQNMDLSSKITPILASVTNQGRLELVCAAFNIQTIYHAAAYKHVPMVEKNPVEAVSNNILGTYYAAQAAIKTEVDTFVLVSTDKAVRPTSTMGASKRFAEMILQGLSQDSRYRTRFTMVRFGNVLGSSGSVVPLFRAQIKNGGPVTVTDPEIIRYFMTIPEAAQLVIQAGAMGQGGDVFVLDMGEPVKILDMARRMIHLSGFNVKDADNHDGDIEIAYTGLRPGEKLYEELLIGEDAKPTQHDLILTAEEESLPWARIDNLIGLFIEAVANDDVEKIRALLMEAVKGFHPQCDVADLVFEKKRASESSTVESNVLEYKRNNRVR
ncbi:MAG: polysaccharide biosynthesis protein [Gammaproteobacteria bacterium]|nr:polysaccharide biosynthesis protein [Gammaproteobacteria bacterium]